MQYKDYYKTLGVNKSASAKEIKQAYRKLARTHHPDVNPGNKQAEERFKEINEAYEVLSDRDKRQKYDQLGADWNKWEQGGGNPGGFDWTRWTGGAGPGFDVRYTSAENLEDLFGGAGMGGSFSDFFQQIFGGMGGARSNRRRSQAQDAHASRLQRGQDYEHEVEITLEEAYQGTTRIMEKDGRRMEIKIPAGSKTGTKIRLAGEGNPAAYGGQAGDLYLRVKVLPHALFERKGADLHTTIKVDMYTALLGGQTRVQTLAGPVTLTIKAETQNGQTIRLKGKGMPKLRQSGEHGDLYAKVEVQLPTGLTPRQRDLIEELRKAG
jgi:curved DNA-binding protein